MSANKKHRQLLYDTIPMPATLWRESGEIISCNNAMVAFLKCGSSEECLERFFSFCTEFQPDGTPSMEKAAWMRRQAIEKGSAQCLWTHIIDDEIVEIELTCAKMIEDGELYISAFARDLREFKRRHAAEEESRAKTQFLARMSHEIRTPMNAVLGITEMQMQKDNLSPETEDAFSRIYASSNLLLSIINDILDLSKVEAGKMEIVDEIYDTANMIVDTVQLNLMHIGSKTIEFKLNVDKNIPAFLIGDEIRIKQVMNNILSNAFKYTDEGTVGLDIRMIDSPYGERSLVFTVTDTGQGMTKEQMDNIFEMEFSRFNLKNNRAIEGSGLGMNISYRLINLMDGRIHVDSEFGKGSTFTIKIPQKQNGDEVLGEQTVESLQNIETSQRALKRMSRLANINMPYGKVLVVDDVESNLYVAKGLLMPYKLTIETVDSGRAAVHKIKNGNIYDIIFMDHMMPGMDGVEATKKIRDLGYTHPIVALTANTAMGQSELFMKNGFSGYIAKPIDVNQLNTYLLRMIRDKQPPEVLAAAAKDQQTEKEPDEKIFSPADEVSARLKESFMRDAKRSSEALAAVIANEHLDVAGFKLYIIHIHAMKSALHNVGELILSSIAAALEQAGRDGDISTIKTFTTGFLHRLDEVVIATKESLDAMAKAHAENPKAAEKFAASSLQEDSDTPEQIIFVVDDADTNLILAEEALDECYNVYTILSAAKMFEMLEKVTPNLILLDIEMPEMNGFEAMKLIKGNPKLNAIPVVFITATITPDVVSKAKKLGVAEVFPKPFTSEILRGKVAEWLSKPGTKPTVLIVDDTPMVISALSRILLPKYSVKAAKDGKEGVDLAMRHPIDLVLLDISMPEFSGFDVLGKLKEHEKTRGIPVIFITGSDEIEDESHGFMLGAVDYIFKPFDEEKVLHRVELHIHGGKVS
ncbi:MAG: response regulator [Clostridiales bacterium]|nr:response regulator [Clostridiales bacterium]